ncbi:MAG: hypothetical protein RL272_1268 [Candidatus Parcubacteria bacterium]|jgi:ABC-type protease/lipase transport system fused ATPase/permease subunit
MKTRNTASLASERLSALFSIALTVAGAVLCFMSHPWLGAGTLYVGGTMFVLTFFRCAAILNRRADDEETA